MEMQLKVEIKIHFKVLEVYLNLRLLQTYVIASTVTDNINGKDFFFIRVPLNKWGTCTYYKAAEKNLYV